MGQGSRQVGEVALPPPPAPPSSLAPPPPRAPGAQLLEASERPRRCGRGGRLGYLADKGSWAG